MCSVSTASSTALVRRCAGAHIAAKGRRSARCTARSGPGRQARANNASTASADEPTNTMRQPTSGNGARKQPTAAASAIATGLPACNSPCTRSRARPFHVSATTAWPMPHSPPTPSPVTSRASSSEPKPCASPVSNAPSENSTMLATIAGLPADAIGEPPEQHAADRSRRQRGAFDPGDVADRIGELQFAGDRALGEGEQDQVVEVEDPTEPAEQQHAAAPGAEETIAELGAGARRFGRRRFGGRA